MVIQGRSIGPDELESVRRLLGEHPTWNRTRLSRELCAAWNWRNDQGLPKDMACCTLLLKLEQRGWITLPPRRNPPINGARNRALPRLDHDRSPIVGELRELLPLSVRPVDAETDERAIFRSASPATRATYHSSPNKARPLPKLYPVNGYTLASKTDGFFTPFCPLSAIPRANSCALSWSFNYRLVFYADFFENVWHRVG